MRTVAEVEQNVAIANDLENRIPLDWLHERSVLVLGPMVPDCATLFRAIAGYPGTLRGVGIPFGECEAEQTQIAEYPAVAEVVGQFDRWIYAVSIIDHPAAVEFLLNWLERYPSCRVAAPHFLCVGKGDIASPLDELRERRGRCAGVGCRAV